MLPQDSLADTDLLALQRHHLLRRVVLSAAALGVAGDLLLRHAPWGLNLATWLTLVVVATADLARRQSRMAGGLWLLLPALLFSLLALGRASPLLAVFNVVAALLALGLHTAASADPRFFVRGAAPLEDTALHLARVGLQAGIGALNFLIGRDRLNLLFPALARRAPGGSITAGLATLILVPILTALLAAGDAVFRAKVLWILRFDFETVAQRVVFFAAIAWASAGVWRYSLGRLGLADAAAPPAHGVATRVSVMPLTALVALVAVFVAQQVRTLIGGAEYVARVTGLTVAEYARSGFFALCVAAGFALAVALWYQTYVDRADAVTVSRFRVRAVSLAALLGLLTAGAMLRMRFYIDAFGLTADRVYASVVIVWVSFLAIWLARCAWVARPAAFVRGSLVAAWVLLFGLNVVNPERVIVNVNAARLARGAEFDLGYATSGLSADAVPVLVQVLLRENADARRAAYTPPCDSVWQLLQKWGGARASERTWRWAEAAAVRAVERRKAELGALACSPPQTSAPVEPPKGP